MKKSVILRTLCLLEWLLVFSGCAGEMSVKTRNHIDSLNTYACQYKFQNLDSTAMAAQQAMNLAAQYPRGYAEACNHLAFASFMQMNMEDAALWHRKAIQTAPDDVEKLVAYVGLMKISQRTAMNKEFFEYRNEALHILKKMNRSSVFMKHRRLMQRYYAARSEYFLTLTIYHYYLQQNAEALACLNKVPAGDVFQSDVSLGICYHYVRGVTGLYGTLVTYEHQLAQFDELFYAYLLAKKNASTFYEANSLLALAAILSDEHGHSFLTAERKYAVDKLKESVDDSFQGEPLPVQMSKKAIMLLKKYGDPYSIAKAYVKFAAYDNLQGHYLMAIDSLQQALNLGLSDAPECMAGIREQLSVSFAGLGRKDLSDNNRNLYLDILEETRQDKAAELHLEDLQHESTVLNFLLALVGVCIVLVMVLFYLFTHWSRQRNKRHLMLLQQLIEIGQQLSVSVPVQAANEEEIIQAANHIVKTRTDHLVRHKEEKMLLQFLQPSIQWAIENGRTSMALVNEQKRLEKERFIVETHMAEHKKQNLMKKACVSMVIGVMPLIDRIANEVDKLLHKGFLNDEKVKEEKLTYIDDLVTAVNEQNEVLTRWITLKQGALNLHIENFELEELFSLLRKRKRTFNQKQLDFQVEATDACVKADKALTLFMLNTLLENARKFTPAGGEVCVTAQSKEQYVEISVLDTGCGLSEADVKRIEGEKVYNSQEIGVKSTTTPEMKAQILREKGSGFGLMNCRGIIEKYRKSGSLFNVCQFKVESALGKGSRFYFRLPLGVRNLLTLWVVVCMAGFCSCSSPDHRISVSGNETWQLADSLQQEEYEALLDTASSYADDAYYSNIDGEYEEALNYIDSAIVCLNEHYRRYADMPNRFMTLTGKGQAAELSWWESTYNTDFHVILDIRNEAAVAFLALKRLKDYQYNNAVYTTLYKLLGEDHSIQSYCVALEKSATYKLVNISLLIVLLLSLPIGYYALYFRNRMRERKHLEHMLLIHKRLSAGFHGAEETDNQAEAVSKQILEFIYNELNSWMHLEGVAIYLKPSDVGFPLMVGWPSVSDKPTIFLMKQAVETQSVLRGDSTEVWPLLVEVGEERRCIGAFACKYHSEVHSSVNALLLQLLVRHIALTIFDAVIKLAPQYRDIEKIQDDARRASYEDEQLYIQNQVLDNCLSTIKHETLYYPNRIRQLTNQVRSSSISKENELEKINAMNELITYYQSIYSLLCKCAVRQLDEVTFKRSTVRVADMMQYLRRYFDKQQPLSNIQLEITCSVEAESALCSADHEEIHILLQSLVNEALRVDKEGSLGFSITMENQFVRFEWKDFRRDKTETELRNLFVAKTLKDSSPFAEKKIEGVEFLLCKQIIREHDEYAGVRGCRINAGKIETGGFLVYFTLPSVKMGVPQSLTR